jgi:hypothetical protein
MALCKESSSVTDAPSAASPNLTLLRGSETNSASTAELTGEEGGCGGCNPGSTAVLADATGDEGGCEGCNPGSTVGDKGTDVGRVRGVIVGEETPPILPAVDTDEDPVAAVMTPTHAVANVSSPAGTFLKRTKQST